MFFELAPAILVGLLSSGAAFSQPRATEAKKGTIRGQVSSPAGQLLPDVVVMVGREGEDSSFQLTDTNGEFVFAGLAPGVYSIIASLPGYEDRVVPGLVLEPGAELRRDVMLQLQRFSESVLIQERVAEGVVDPRNEPIEVAIEELDLLPLPTDRFQEVFPLVPGVVRDSDGRLSFNGARPSQSTLLVNGANATDPLTGEFAVEIPLRAIEAVEVNTIPYSAEYGQVTAAVAKVRTRGGTDEWDVDFSNLLPKLNFRDGKIKGIRAAVPQVGVSGPIKKGKLWFSQGVAYRFVRSRVYDAELGDDERRLEGVDSFTQLDWRMAENHHLTTTFSYFPVEWDNLGLTALTASDATPDFNSWGWNAAFSERSYFSRSVVETILAVKSFDVAVRPKTREASVLTPDGLRGNYFDILNRESMLTELGTSLTHSMDGRLGEHVLKVGARAVHSSFSGTDEGLPIEVRDASGALLRDIRFEGSPRIGGSDVVVSAYAQDQWRITRRLGFDFGLRFDYDRLVGSHQFAPRVSAAYALDAAGTTVVKGGFGLFYDHVFLHAESFDGYQTRIETRYDANGVPRGPSIAYVPRFDAGGLEMPRAVTWNVELDHFLSDGVELRFNYRERRGSDEMVVDVVEESEAGTGSLVLSSEGSSSTRELDVTARVYRGDNELFFSYVKSRTTGDLNNFGTLYQNLREPLLFANENSLLPFDVPHRFLFWGIWRLPKDIQISPGVEWRTGFPYSVYDVDYTPDGERNRGGRFPDFLSLDVRVTKGLHVIGRDIRVGFQIYNLGSHLNPRDVVSNMGSSRFGEYLNSVDMSFSLRLSLGL